MTMSNGAEARAARPNWLTIPQAAAYLGVSEPTIYRWMKDGLLSFYKVGGGTRFSQDGLDAVIEKTTGRKEAEAATGRCASCGHSILIEGRLQGTGRLYFKPDHTKFWVFDESLVPTKARVCAACGYVQMHADTEKLNRLSPKEEGEGEEESEG
ncbi:MAG: helix-turn-helix domain-containing protein [Planctomycetota bacterium]|jgi:excisionase family DNA binding protein